LSSERGSLLVEVMVGALVLAITTFAVMNGLDGAQKTGLMNKQRSVSATLAQQDIERLRAYPITSLSNFSQSRAVKVAGVTYTVDSKTEWVTDSTDPRNCTDQTGSSDYVKISSSVKSPAQRTPIKEVSLLTPAAGALSDTHGTLAVKVTNRHGQPRVGAPVSLSGAASLSKTTNELGCAVFDFIPAGAYNVDVPGMVGWGGDGAAPAQATVTAGKTSLSALEREPPVKIVAQFQRPDGSAATWDSMRVANAKLPGGAADYSAPSAVTSIEGGGLYPFLDGIGVWAGGPCSRNNPAVHQTNPPYFQVGGKGFVTFPDGDTEESVLVQMAELTVNVKDGGTDVANASVYVRQRDDNTGCNRGLLMATGTTDSAGNARFALPFGLYRICAGNGSRSRTTSSNNPTDPLLRPQSLTAHRDLSLGNNGACPTALDV
jgi:Tfp pilus assembly protein PilV